MTHSIRHKKKSDFLTAFSDCGNVTLACKMAGIGRKTHYRWLEDDANYAEAFKDAEQSATDHLEAEAWRRAVEGVEKPTGWYKGKAGGTVREYSDLLLIFLLKGMRPEKYRERHQIDPNGNDLSYTVALVSPTTDEEGFATVTCDADAHLFIDDTTATASARAFPRTYNCFIGGFCAQAAISYPPADYGYTNAYEHDKPDQGTALAAGCNVFPGSAWWGWAHDAALAFSSPHTGQFVPSFGGLCQ